MLPPFLSMATVVSPVASGCAPGLECGAARSPDSGDKTRASASGAGLALKVFPIGILISVLSSA
jgi:hypothetical protein